MELRGSYSTCAIIVTSLIFIVTIAFNFLYIVDLFRSHGATEQIVFITIFIDLMFMLLLVAPVLSKYLDGLGDACLTRFLDLPEKDDKIDAQAITSFISDQALGAFLGTTVLFLGKETLHKFGATVAAIVAFIIFLSAIIVMSISLIRFVSYFTKYKWLHYFLASAASVAIMFGFFGLGISMGS